MYLDTLKSETIDAVAISVYVNADDLSRSWIVCEVTPGIVVVIISFSILQLYLSMSICVFIPNVSKNCFRRSVFSFLQ